MYGFSLNNAANEQLDPLLRFGSTQFGQSGSTPGTSNWQGYGSADSISTSSFGSNGVFGSSGLFGSNGSIFGSNGGGLASMLGSFGSYVQSMFGQIAQWIQNYSSQLQTLASGQGSTSAQNGNGQYGNGQYGNGQYGLSGAQQNLGPQQYFTSADAGSAGDPHDAFNGTSSANGNINNHWDDMHSHRQLLSSDSFRGGYRVSTCTSQPNSNGATTNSSATVTTDGGNTSVTLNADGTSSVLKRGQPITLQAGVSTSLGNGESVTLNADGSLSVQMQNPSGGTIVTTLAANNGGVDVSDHAENVDLGGYLVTRSN